MQQSFQTLTFLLLLLSLSSCSWFLSTYNGPTLVSHEYVKGVTPADIEAFSSRSYPTLQANWPGPGGDKIWLAVNLGATVKPETSADTNPNSAGWYFQFNRKQGYYHSGSTVIPQWTIQSIKEDTSWKPANDPCRILLGEQWRLPNVEELRAFRSAPISEGGMGEGNRTNAFNSDLRLHAAGSLHGFSSELIDRGQVGTYWASDQFDDDQGEALGISRGSGTFGGNKAFGRNVRCVKDDV